MMYTLVIFVVAAMPGYIVAALTIDRLGRKKIQCLGFAMMTLSYGLLALVPGLTQSTLPFLSLYSLGYFLQNLDPTLPRLSIPPRSSRP